MNTLISCSRMKRPRCKSIILILLVLNFAAFIYFINNKKFWPQEKVHKIPPEAVENSITVVIYDFEHFENDVVNTVKSFLEYHPDLNILIVSNDLPYPPLQLPENAKVKLVVLNVEVNLPGKEGQPLRFIETNYSLFVPDGFRLTQPYGLRRLLQQLRRSGRKTKMLATGAEGYSEELLTCDKLNFDYRRWTLKYSSVQKSLISGNKLCDAVSGSVAILMQTSHLHDLNTVFIRPFLKALFIQSALRDWKTVLVLEKSPFFQEHQLFRSQHNRWKHERNRKQQEKDLYKKFGVKKIENGDGTTTWLGCSKQTPRCFGTIVKDVASFIHIGRWTPPCCLRNLRETTRHVLGLFEDLKIEYWLEGGSLLGAARHGDVIPWDYDVDIGMYKGDVDKIPNLKRAKEGEKIEDEKGFVWEKGREGDFYRVQFSTTNHMHVDIFPFYEKNGIMTKDTWFSSHRQDTEFQVKYLKPLERLKFIDMNVLVPNNRRELLEFKFGNGVIENPRYPNSRKVKM